MASQALIVALPPTPAAEANAGVSPPFDDPEDASDRSCALDPAGGDAPTGGWLLAFGAAIWLRRRRDRAPSRCDAPLAASR